MTGTPPERRKAGLSARWIASEIQSKTINGSALPVVSPGAYAGPSRCTGRQTARRLGSVSARSKRQPENSSPSHETKNPSIPFPSLLRHRKDPRIGHGVPLIERTVGVLRLP